MDNRMKSALVTELRTSGLLRSYRIPRTMEMQTTSMQSSKESLLVASFGERNDAGEDENEIDRSEGNSRPYEAISFGRPAA